MKAHQSGSAVSQFDLEFAFRFSVHPQPQRALGGTILDGQVRVTFVYLDREFDVAQESTLLFCDRTN